MNKFSLTDVMLSCAVTVLGVWAWPGFPLGGLLFGALAGLALLWRRRRPVTVLAVVAVLTVVVSPLDAGEFVAFKLAEAMLLLVLGLAMYAVIVHAAKLWVALICWFGTPIFAAVLSATRAVNGPGWVPFDSQRFMPSVGATAFLGAVVGGVALVVRFTRQQRGAQRRSTEQLAVAEERAQIARELHDIVAHSLSVMILQANGAEYAFDRDPARAREALRAIGRTGGDALEEIRQLVDLLRGDATGPATPDRIETVVDRARDAGLTVALVVDGTPPELPTGVALAVYRIVQESLTNALKHAGASPSATVHVTYGPDAVEVEVTDAGLPAGAGPELGGGHGLIGMRERATLYGGTFEAGPRPGGGWRVHAGVPLTADRLVAA